MTPSEFKAWFEGFTEAFDKTPTKEQWARIKKRVAEIDGQTITEKIFVDRYWPYYSRTIWNTPQPSFVPSWPTITCTANTSGTGGVSSYNSTAAMYALGKADAQNIT